MEKWVLEKSENSSEGAEVQLEELANFFKKEVIKMPAYRREKGKDVHGIGARTAPSDRNQAT
ncbi:MAG: hypothetical protein WBB67_12970 [bacterium]